jgi:hypothetical protein
MIPTIATKGFLSKTIRAMTTIQSTTIVITICRGLSGLGSRCRIDPILIIADVSTSSHSNSAVFIDDNAATGLLFIYVEKGNNRGGECDK